MDWTEYRAWFISFLFDYLMAYISFVAIVGGTLDVLFD